MGGGRLVITALIQRRKPTPLSGLPSGVHSYAAVDRLPNRSIRTSPPHRAADVVYEDRWGQPYRDQ